MFYFEWKSVLSPTCARKKELMIAGYVIHFNIIFWIFFPSKNSTQQERSLFEEKYNLYLFLMGAP